MKKNILFGTLVFFLSMFMVACGKKRAATPSGNTTITVPSQPGIALGTDGQLSTTCSQNSCRFFGSTNVSQPELFAQIGGGQIFAPFNQNSGQFGFDIGGSFQGQIENGIDWLEDNCKLNFGISFGGDGRDIVSQVNCQTQSEKPQVVPNYHTAIITSASQISVTLRVTETQNLSIRAVNNGDGRYFDPNLGVIIRPLPAGNIVDGFVIQQIVNNQPVETAVVRVSGNLPL